MSPGPNKSFDPATALEAARDVFWRHGYDGASLRELELAMQINRKSLYDTFGDKRGLYLQSIEQYTDSVIQRICDGLANPKYAPLANLERVLGRLQEHHASANSLGCLLGVAMAQTNSADHELGELLRGYLRRLESAFTQTLQQAQAAGSIRDSVVAEEVAAQLVVTVQGMALMGRIQNAETLLHSTVRATLQALHP